LKNCKPQPNSLPGTFAAQGDDMKRAIIILIVATLVAVEFVPMFMDMQ
jgi:hypothetical protein